MFTAYRHTDGRTLCLGKKPAKVDNKRFMLTDFLPKCHPPASANWFGSVTDFGMMLNDQLGDCTCAAIGHAEQVATLNSLSGEVTPVDELISLLYEHSCGYVPGDPNTDQGGVITDVLDFVREHTLGMHKPEPHMHHRPTLYAYADPDPGDINHVKQAIATFWVVDIGLQLPLTAQSQVGGLWDVVGDPNTDPDSQPGSWGGHSIVVSAYDADTVTGITWGQLQKMTWRFWRTYVDESHALLMFPWLEKAGGIPNLNMPAIEKALAALNN